jgi:hypothetical protein
MNPFTFGLEVAFGGLGILAGFAIGLAVIVIPKILRRERSRNGG